MEQRIFNVVILFLTLMMLFTGLLSGCDRDASGSPVASGSSISSHGGGSF